MHGLRRRRRHLVLMLATAAALSGGGIAGAADDDSDAQVGEDQDGGEEATYRPPDLFDCERLDWMESCEGINRYRRENPDGPLRMRTRNGVEMNFPENTPTAVIRFYVLQTPESARAYVRHVEAILEHRDTIARMAGEARQELGIDTSPGSFTSATPETTSTNSGGAPPAEDVTVYLFYNGDDAPSRTALKAVRDLAHQYPDIDLSVLQMAPDPDVRQRFAERYGVNPRILEGEARAEWIERLQRFPTTIVEHAGGSAVRLQGATSTDAIVNAIQRVAAEAS